VERIGIILFTTHVHWITLVVQVAKRPKQVWIMKCTYM